MKNIKVYIESIKDISEALKINSKSKVNSGDTYTFDLDDYKETINLPFLLKILGEEEEIKICKIDVVYKEGKPHIRLIDEKDKVATVLRDTNVINLFKKHKSEMGIIYNINGNAYYRTETFKIDNKDIS